MMYSNAQLLTIHYKCSLKGGVSRCNFIVGHTKIYPSIGQRQRAEVEACAPQLHPATQHHREIERELPLELNVVCHIALEQHALLDKSSVDQPRGGLVLRGVLPNQGDKRGSSHTPHDGGEGAVVGPNIRELWGADLEAVVHQVYCRAVDVHYDREATVAGGDGADCGMDPAVVAVHCGVIGARDLHLVVGLEVGWEGVDGDCR